VFNGLLILLIPLLFSTNLGKLHRNSCSDSYTSCEASSQWPHSEGVVIYHHLSRYDLLSQFCPLKAPRIAHFFVDWALSLFSVCHDRDARPMKANLLTSGDCCENGWGIESHNSKATTSHAYNGGLLQ
jgi:hypothetical protein